MKTRSLIVLFVFLATGTGMVTGQTFNKAKEDSLLTLLEEKDKAMGSIAVLENGKVIYSRAIGFANDSPAKVPSNEKTKYRIGSISKMFTSVLIFQLIEEGKLGLTTTLDKFYPGIPNAGKITIANMLGHRSGIHSFTDDPDYLSWCHQAKTRQEMVEMMSKGKVEFEPDTKTAYSNSNFVLLGYIAEDLRKKPYNELLQKNICSKAGLTDTYYGGKADISKNESVSFRLITGWQKEPETDMSIPHGAGAIISTPTDLVKFIDALFEGKLVSNENLAKMKTITDGLGLGMMQFPYGNNKLYGHGGGIDGFSSILCYLPESKLAVAYCSNGTAWSINEILLRTLNNYFGQKEKLPEFRTVSIDPARLQKYAGSYSSSQIPIKIAIIARDGRLFGQGSGQPEFPFEASDTNVFRFDQAGVVIRFTPGKDEFALEQGGGKFTFKKD